MGTTHSQSQAQSRGQEIASFFTRFLIRPIALFGTLGGIIALEGPEENLAQFSPLTGAEAQSLGISESDQTIYNSEVDRLNLIREDVYLSVREKNLSRPTDAVLSESAEEWKEHFNVLSPESVKVAGIIAKSALSKRVTSE